MISLKLHKRNNYINVIVNLFACTGGTFCPYFQGIEGAVLSFEKVPKLLSSMHADPAKLASGYLVQPAANETMAN